MKVFNYNPEIRKLNLYLGNLSTLGAEELVADDIRHLPGVVRVQADAEERKLEIWVRMENEGIIRRITSILESFGCYVVAGEMRLAA